MIVLLVIIGFALYQALDILEEYLSNKHQLELEKLRKGNQNDRI